MVRDLKQTRNIDIKLHTRAASSGNDMFIEGYFALYGVETMLWEGAYEAIAPGAFDDALNDDVRALVNHDTSLVLGRNKSGTLELKSDAKGLWGRIKINPNDADAVNLYHRVARNDVTGCSFGFNILDEETDFRQDGSIKWIIRKVKLFEVSVCTYPQYEQTGVQVRKKQYDQAKEQMKQRGNNKPKGEKKTPDSILDQEQRRQQLRNKLRAASTQKQTHGGEEVMKTRNLNHVMTRSQRSEYLNKPEVRSFYKKLSEVRNMQVAIPEIVLNVIRDGLYEHSKLLKYVRLKPVKGSGRQIISDNVIEAVWTEACAALHELELGLNGYEFESYKLGGYIPVCKANLEDANEDALSEDVEFMLMKAIGYALDKAIIYGTGNRMPLGFASRLGQLQKPSNYPEYAPEWKDLHTSNIKSLNGTTLTGVDLFKALIKETVHADNNGSHNGMVLAMNEKTWKGSILPESLTISGGLITTANGGFFPALNANIEFLDFIPEGDIVGGYLEKYLLAERRGGEIGSSDHVGFLTDERVFKGTADYDGLPLSPESFITINVNNEQPATTVPFAYDLINP